MHKLGVDKLVSVIMPAFNAEKTIYKSIISVLTQSYSYLELIVIDDNSSDSTVSVVQNINDPRVHLIKNEGVRGVSNARNIGLDYANGEYIAFLDSDDIWLEDKIIKQIEAMKRTGLHCAHSTYLRFNDDLNFQLSIEKTYGIVTFHDMLKSNLIGNLTGIYNRNFVGIVKQECIGHEDYLMWLNILQKTNSIGLIDELAVYRVRKGSLSSNKLKAMFWHYRILRTYLGLHMIDVMKYMVFYIWKSICRHCYEHKKNNQCRCF